MTTDDDLREIEAALHEFQDASERVYEASPDPGFGDPVQQQKDARKVLMALIRQKLPQSDAEHERAVEAWAAEARRVRCSDQKPPDYDLSCDRFIVDGSEIDDALRLMRARPVAKDKAAVELLRVAKRAYDEQMGSDLWRELGEAIEAFERAIG